MTHTGERLMRTTGNLRDSDDEIQAKQLIVHSEIKLAGGER